MIDRQSSDHRPKNGRYPASVCRRFFDKMSSTDRLAIDGRYHNVNFFKTSADCRPFIGRQSPDAWPMTKPMKIGGLANETFNFGASIKKKSFKIGADVGRKLAEVARFYKLLLIDRRPTVGLGNVTVDHRKLLVMNSLWGTPMAKPYRPCREWQ